ncbi:hypothetical protein M9H77_03133 [Catharanthus roseus]|uniref:Uncharacterized protein n=1 Tax=Catharanthus roseus TaxID=4058 RepID=A0ACC0CAE0_CATRO|nr:hypothetical protein M9H77_03133 [Catharanthus roseus]
MLGKCTLDLDPVVRGRSAVGSLEGRVLVPPDCILENSLMALQRHHSIPHPIRSPDIGSLASHAGAVASPPHFEVGFGYSLGGCGIDAGSPLARFGCALISQSWQFGNCHPRHSQTPLP